MTEKVAAMQVPADKFPLSPELEEKAKELLERSLRREACCDIFLTDWERRDAYTDEEGNQWPEVWRITALGKECQTALEWKKKADYSLDRLRELAQVRANPPQEGSPSPTECYFCVRGEEAVPELYSGT